MKRLFKTAKPPCDEYVLSLRGQFLYNSSYYHHQIGGFNLFYCCHIFPSWRYWTSKMLVECVSKIKSILSFIFHAIYGAVYILQLTNISYDGCENTCIWSYYHHQIGSMAHLPLFRIRLWNNGMCCMSFYILLWVITTISSDKYFEVILVLKYHASVCFVL